MAPDEKLHKTGGSYIDFCSWGTFCNVTEAVITAALPGNFLKAQKYDNFNAIF